MSKKEFAYEGNTRGPQMDYRSEALKVTKNDPHIVFVEDVAVALGTTVATLAKYEVSLGKFPELAELLRNNKTAVKKKLRKKWEDSDKNSFHLYKILSRKDEHDKLVGSPIEFKGEPIKIIVNPGEKEEKSD